MVTSPKPGSRPLRTACGIRLESQVVHRTSAPLEITCGRCRQVLTASTTWPQLGFHWEEVRKA